MTSQETFITRLRRQRERNRISLDEIIGETRIKREQLEAFEQGDLSAWPRGIYARAWIRGYASIVGLDPTDTVDEFCKLFPQGDRRAEGTLREFAAIIAHESAYQDEFAHADGDRRRKLPQAEAIPTSTFRDFVMRLTRVVRSVRPTRTSRAVGTMRAN